MRGGTQGLCLLAQGFQRAHACQKGVASAWRGAAVARVAQMRSPPGAAAASLCDCQTPDGAELRMAPVGQMAGVPADPLLLLQAFWREKKIKNE